MAPEGFVPGLWERLVEMSPQIVAAVMVLAIGWTIGRIVGKAFVTVFTRTGLDRAVEKTIVGQALERSGVSSLAFFDQLVRWSIYLLAILGAIDFLQIEAASLFMRRVFEYLPNLIGGVLVLFVGLVISEILSGSFNSKSLIVKQPLDFQDGVDILFGIHPIASAVFPRRQVGEFRFPIAQDIRPQAGDFTYLADGIIQFFDIRCQKLPQ